MRRWTDIGDDAVRERENSLARSLETTLSQMPGVLKARVHIALKDTRLLARNPRNETVAAVVLWQRPSDVAIRPDPVRRLLLSSIPDLASPQLTVQVVSNAADPGKTDAQSPRWIDREARSVIIALLGMCMLLATGWIRIGLLRRRERRNAAVEFRN